MRSLIKKIIILCSLIYITNIGIACFLDHLYESNFSGYQGGTLNYYLKTQKSDTLLVGSSSVMHNLIPRYFGKNTFNLSCQEMHLGYQEAVIELLFQHNKLPSKVLLFEINSEDIHKKVKEKLVNQMHYLKYYYDKNQFIHDQINNISKVEFLKFYLTSYRHNGSAIRLISNSLNKRNDYPKQKGYFPLLPSKLDSARMIYTQRINEKEQFFNSKTINPDALNLINRIQYICKKRNIKLIMITSPYYVPPLNIIKASNYLENYLKKKKIPFLNYLTKTNHSYMIRDLWFDNFHFNSKGAVVFSKIVHHDMSLTE